MPWTPRQESFRGLHGVFKALRMIVETNITDVLNWANNNLDLELEPFDNIYWGTPHARGSRVLIIEPVTGASPQGERTLEHLYSFNVNILLVGEDVNQLGIDLIGYLTAVQLLLLSASRSDWVQFFAPGSAAFQQIDCGSVRFDQVEASEEESSLFIRGCSMELLITVSEVMP